MASIPKDSSRFSAMEHYVPVLETSTSSDHQPASQRSLPILADSQRSYRYDYGNTDTACATGVATARCHGMLMNEEIQGGKWARTVQTCKRWSVDAWWRLSRGMFAVPLPFLTVFCGFKLCDIVMTLPFIAMLFGFSVRSALLNDVATSGWPATVGLILTFIFVVRKNPLLLLLTGISFERGLFYHKIFAVSSMLLAGLHGWSHFRVSKLEKQPKVVTGLVCFCAMVMLIVFSLSLIRRRFFCFFVRAHWLFFIIVIVYAVVHGATLVLLGAAPWAIDMVYRILYQARMYSHGSSTQLDRSDASLNQSSRGLTSRGQVTIMKLADDMMRMQFQCERVDTEEIFAFSADQYILVCVPEISMLEWHPFSVSSSPTESAVTLHIKVVGDWTRRLYKLAGNADVGEHVPVDILVDGPYGGVSIDIYRPQTYSHFVLLSEGVGVLPMRSVVTWLHHEYTSHHRDVIRRVHFVWSVHLQHELKTLVTDDTSENDPNNFFVAAKPRQKARFHHAAADPFSFDLSVAERQSDTASPSPLDSSVHFGCRPDHVQILRDMGGGAQQSGSSRVAVLASHTSSDIVSACLAVSKSLHVSFDVHQEHFYF
ncbi:unnamed protein product [Phytophthora fragariaefolia]|uniref:Unnamed protein product n=1 Tax=Phytophthora fragariaefolia TaxID=1490495 RepID=A0A9W6U4E1_9STRA|nr:unnamed protein product [Phytophthora fragariaefolia]